MINDIIKFYKSFDRYKNNTDQELYYYLFESYKNKQYKVFKDTEIYGFVNWGLLNKSTKDNYLRTGYLDDWSNGDIIQHVDLLAKKNIKEVYVWSRENLKKHLGINQTTKWLSPNSLG